MKKIFRFWGFEIVIMIRHDQKKVAANVEGWTAAIGRCYGRSFAYVARGATMT